MVLPVVCSRENRIGRSRAVRDATRDSCICLLAGLHPLCLSKALSVVNMGGQCNKTIVEALIHQIIDSSMAHRLGSLACISEMSKFPGHPELGVCRDGLKVH